MEKSKRVVCKYPADETGCVTPTSPLLVPFLVPRVSESRTEKGPLTILMVPPHLGVGSLGEERERDHVRVSKLTVGIRKNKETGPKL